MNATPWLLLPIVPSESGNSEYWKELPAKNPRIMDSREWLAQTQRVVEGTTGMRKKFLDMARTKQRNTNEFTDMGRLEGL